MDICGWTCSCKCSHRRSLSPFLGSIWSCSKQIHWHKRIRVSSCYHLHTLKELARTLPRCSFAFLLAELQSIMWRLCSCLPYFFLLSFFISYLNWRYFISKDISHFWPLCCIYILPMWKQRLALKITDGLCIYGWITLKLLTCVVFLSGKSIKDDDVVMPRDSTN